MDGVSQFSAENFDIQYVIEATQSLLTVVAEYTTMEYENPNKFYVVKVLFNDQPSVEQDHFDNEIQILSTLTSHPNIVPLESNFTSIIPESFTECMPENVQLEFNEDPKLKLARKRFIVYNYHPRQLSDWLLENPLPLCLESVLELAEEILTIFEHLEKHQICHLDIQLSDFCKKDDNSIVLNELQHAVRYEGGSFMLPASRAALCNSDSPYVAPEVLNGLIEWRQNTPPLERAIDCSSQSSFAAGALIMSAITGTHPLPGYPSSYRDSNDIITSTEGEFPPLPSLFPYPKSLQSILLDLLQYDPDRRLELGEALNQLRVCCRRKSVVSRLELRKSVKEKEGNGVERNVADKNSAVEEQDRAQRDEALRLRDAAIVERDIAICERDTALAEVEKLSIQSEKMNEDFQSHCELLLEEIEQLRRDRDSAVEASSNAYQASELLKLQLTLVTRERDLAQAKVEELRDVVSKAQPEEQVMDCTTCHKFFIESRNTSTSCNWHTGFVSSISLNLYQSNFAFLSDIAQHQPHAQLNRWSCCYKREKEAVGCKTGQHSARTLLLEHAYDMVAS